MAMYLVSTKAKGLRFKVMAKPTPLPQGGFRVALMGDTGTVFERVINDEVLAEYGYRVEHINEKQECAAS